MAVSQKKPDLEVLRRHADLILETARTDFPEADDIRETESRHSACIAMFNHQLHDYSSVRHLAERGAGEMIK